MKSRPSVVDSSRNVEDLGRTKVVQTYHQIKEDVKPQNRYLEKRQ